MWVNWVPHKRPEEIRRYLWDIQKTNFQDILCDIFRKFLRYSNVLRDIFEFRVHTMWDI